MANTLTGDYEAVLQVSVRQINGLLATSHQNGAKGSGLSPSFPHSVVNLRVGDLPKYLGVEVVEVGDAGADVEELANARVAGEVAHGPA